MRTNRLQLSIAVGILALSAFECMRAYPQLPDLIASNFGGDGIPGGWSSKRSFISVYCVSMAFWFGALLAAPLLAAKARQTVDEPTRCWLRDSVGWFLVASLGLSATITHWVLEANLETGRLSSAFVWLLAIYMGYLLWGTARLVRRIRRKDRRV